jgi:hypothetical protein
MSQYNINLLLWFDAIFLIDRFLEIFVSFYNPNGQLEHKLHSVILNNISMKLFLEGTISLAPLFIYNITALNYAMLKILRYGRLFEMDAIISNIIEMQAATKTVFEIKLMERRSELFKFILSTLCNLHIMSCTQIMLCKARGDMRYPESWMG